MQDNEGVPPARYVQAEYVLGEMARFGHRRLNRLDPFRVSVLALIGGGFITAGALFFSLLVMETGWTGWDEAILENLIPAGIGNLVGGTLLVALPFWYALRPLSRSNYT